MLSFCHIIHQKSSLVTLKGKDTCRVQKAGDTTENKDGRSEEFDFLFRNMLIQDHSYDDAKAVGNNHAQGGTCQDREDFTELSGDGNRSQLGFITHFGDEEGNGYGPKGTEVVLLIFTFELIAADSPQAEDDEGNRGSNFDEAQGEDTVEVYTDEDSQEVIYNSCGEDGGHNRFPGEAGGKGHG